jgi:hypothetical protein
MRSSCGPSGTCRLTSQTWRGEAHSMHSTQSYAWCWADVGLDGVLLSSCPVHCFTIIGSAAQSCSTWLVAC